MNGNYHWQQHLANERVQARRREGEAWRLLKEDQPRRELLLIRIWKRFLQRKTADVQPQQTASRPERAAGHGAL